MLFNRVGTVFHLVACIIAAVGAERTLNGFKKKECTPLDSKQAEVKNNFNLSKCKKACMKDILCKGLQYHKKTCTLLKYVPQFQQASSKKWYCAQVIERTLTGSEKNKCTEIDLQQAEVKDNFKLSKCKKACMKNISCKGLQHHKKTCTMLKSVPQFQQVSSKKWYCAQVIEDDDRMPTSNPSVSPSASKTKSPSVSPSASTTESPSASPSASPTDSSSVSPSASKTKSPSVSPSASTTESPSASPSASPTVSSSDIPSASPTTGPVYTMSPTKTPTTPTTAAPHMAHSNYFKSSPCNDNVDTAPCVGIHSFLSSQSPATTEVKVSCGTCVSMNVTGNASPEVFHFPHGFNIVGKLNIPENASFELRTRYLLVQGIVQMDPPATTQTTMPRADGAKIKVVLTGSEIVQFYPDAETYNGMACGGMDIPCTIGIKPFAIAGGRLDINAIDDACPSWTKLQYLSTNKTQITLTNPAAAACWTTGAEIMFTPDGIARPHDTQVATISSSDPLTGMITLQIPLVRKVTAVQDGYGEEHAVEVALLTRRITLEPEGDNSDLIGGHTIVLHTPNIVQNIKGIEFRRFGQQGNLGRYPIHFHMSESVYGSKVIKNLVRESNQRCYVIHGTHNVTLEENVAYDTFGHCYMTEDGGEWDNSFIRNLGAKTKVPAKIIRNGESDKQPTTFWMPTPVNHYRGNVAAGSSDFGFWLEPMLRGPSADLAINAGKHPTTLPMGTFEDNVAHSNAGQGIAFYPKGYRPPVPQVSRRLISLKNGGAGIRVGGGSLIHLEGGLIADNDGGGVECSGGSYNLVRDLTIERISSHQQAMLAEGRSTLTPCSTGITFPADKGRGSEFHNLVMRGFDNSTGCPAMAFAPTGVSPREGVYKSFAVFNNITFDSPTTYNRISVCEAVGPRQNGNSIRNIAIDDLSADLSPTGEVGFFLQDNDPGLLTFMPSNCQSVGGCLKFCPSSCYRHILITTSGAAIHEGKQMVVTNVSTNTSVATPRYVFNRFWGTHDVALFGIALPGASTYTISWIDQNGKIAWPGYVKLSFKPMPECSPALEESAVTFVSSPNERCDNIVYNGNLERGDYYGWQENHGSGLSMLQGGAEGTSWALRTNKVRRNGWFGLWNFVDASCLQAWAGNFIRISGYARLLNMKLQDVACQVWTCALEVEFKINEQIIFMKKLFTDGSWAKVDDIVYLPEALAANAIEGALIIQGGHRLHLAIDEWRIEDLGDISFEYETQPGTSRGCSPGYGITSVEECKVGGLDAGGRLRNGAVVAGSWNNVPCGCSLQNGLDIHFDTNMLACEQNSGEFFPVCRKMSSDAPSTSQYIAK